jgi:hypothetical protein
MVDERETVEMRVEGMLGGSEAVGYTCNKKHAMNEVAPPFPVTFQCREVGLARNTYAHRV